MILLLTKIIISILFLNCGNIMVNAQDFDWEKHKAAMEKEERMLTNFGQTFVKMTKEATFIKSNNNSSCKEEGLLDKIDSETEFYPGYLRETGLGITYQRMLWKGLFASVEVLPQYKTYLDKNDDKIANGFKLYTSYHVGYHIAFGKKKRFFVEPQVHGQNWIFDTNTPEEFKNLDNKWKNYFLFEPNLYFGYKF